MRTIPLRPLLGADAAMCLAAGALLTLAAGPLSGLLALPDLLTRGTGLILLPWGAFVAWVATRPGRRTVLAVVVVNVIWAADSVLLLASGWVAPNPLGIGFVLIQAVASLLLALLQALALPPAATTRHA